MKINEGVLLLDLYSHLLFMSSTVFKPLKTSQTWAESCGLFCKWASV